jgi:hypothetical protein
LPESSHASTVIAVRLAIIQPYFLPYIGYFQLMAAVDKIVLLDDVNFINRGWINRNRIAINGEPHWFTIPLVKANQNRRINEITIVDGSLWKTKIMRSLELSYRRAPFAAESLALVAELLQEAHGSLSTFLFRQLRRVADAIGIVTSIVCSSELHPRHSLTGQDRIVEICVREGASTYVNPPGGRELYDRRVFAAAGVDLFFLDPNLSSLTLHHSGQEGPCLSILDLLMLNPVPAIREAALTSHLSKA